MSLRHLMREHIQPLLEETVANASRGVFNLSLLAKQAWRELLSERSGTRAD